MATTRLMTTVLPYSVTRRTSSTCHCSSRSDSTAAAHCPTIAAMPNWVKTLKSATITLHSAEAGATPDRVHTAARQDQRNSLADSVSGGHPGRRLSRAETHQSRPGTASTPTDTRTCARRALRIGVVVTDRPPPRRRKPARRCDLLTRIQEENTAHVVICSSGAVRRRAHRSAHKLEVRSGAGRPEDDRTGPAPPRRSAGPAIAAGCPRRERPWRSPIDPIRAGPRERRLRRLDHRVSWISCCTSRAAAAGNRCSACSSTCTARSTTTYRKEEQVPPQPDPIPRVRGPTPQQSPTSTNESRRPATSRRWLGPSGSSST